MEENKSENNQDQELNNEQNQNEEAQKNENNPEPIQENTPPTYNENKELEYADGGSENPIDTHATEALMDIQRIDVGPVYHTIENVKKELAKVIIGQEDMIEFLMISLMVGGHCLLEGLPGIAKTMTARNLAKTIDSDYSRIQFTPDLMPTDVSGTSVFNMKEGDFYFKQGPVFSNIVLIDEINRAPAKTQASLMEIMEEKQLTYDGVTYKMEEPFFVVATQNPIEQEGTYRLPEAQLDRFLFRIKLNYPDLEQEKAILKLFQNDFKKSKEETIEKVLTKADLEKCRSIVEQVHIKEELLNYIATIVDDTRNNGDIFLGASPRASLAIMKTAKAMAAIRGRDFVTPDDIQDVCYPVLNHRLVISYEREMEGSSVEDIIKNILLEIEVPR